jgi:hypothetical protein
MLAKDKLLLFLRIRQISRKIIENGKLGIFKKLHIFRRKNFSRNLFNERKYVQFFVHILTHIIEGIIKSLCLLLKVC